MESNINKNQKDDKLSFSGRVKDELSYQIGSAMHCRIAEIAAIVCFCGKVHVDEDGKMSLRVETENVFVSRKLFTLLRKTFNIETIITIRSRVHTKGTRTYILRVEDDFAVRKVLSASKLLNDMGELEENYEKITALVLRQECCKRAFLRGAFLSAGSISEPGKTYHFEIVCPTYERAEWLLDMMKVFQIDGKYITRKKYHVVYIKEASQIVDILNVMGAFISLMDLENVRILKEMRNSVNRRVNCETANISKTVSAARKQIEDIEFIRDHAGFGELTEALREMAEVRLEYPEASLSELGGFLSTPVGKSGVNHRLRKLSAFADELRTNF